MAASLGDRSRACLRLGPNRARVDCLASAAAAAPGDDARASPSVGPVDARFSSAPPTASKARRVSCRNAGFEGVRPAGELHADGAGTPAHVQQLTVDAEAEQHVAVLARDGTRTGCGTSRRGRTPPPASRGSAVRTSASTAQARRSHRGGTTVTGAAVLARHHSAVEQHLAEPQQVAGGGASPPSCTAVPSPSQMISASCSAPIGAQTRSLIRSAIRAPAARSHTQPSDVGLRRSGRGNGSPCAASARSVGEERVEPARPLAGSRRPGRDPPVEPADLGVGVRVVLAEAHPAAHVEQVPDGRAGVAARGELGDVVHDVARSGRARRGRPGSPATQPTTDLVTDRTAWVWRGPPSGAYSSATSAPSWSTA